MPQIPLNWFQTPSLLVAKPSAVLVVVKTFTILLVARPSTIPVQILTIITVMFSQVVRTPKLHNYRIHIAMGNIIALQTSSLLVAKIFTILLVAKATTILVQILTIISVILTQVVRTPKLHNCRIHIAMGNIVALQTPSLLVAKTFTIFVQFMIITVKFTQVVRTPKLHS